MHVPAVLVTGVVQVTGGVRGGVRVLGYGDRVGIRGAIPGTNPAPSKDPPDSEAGPVSPAGAGVGGLEGPSRAGWALHPVPTLRARSALQASLVRASAYSRLLANKGEIPTSIQ